MIPYKLLLYGGAVAAFVALESWAIHAAHKRGFQEAKAEYELVQIQRDQLSKWFLKLRQSIIEQHPELTESLANFQFRDLRAKSATDIYLNNTLTDAKEQLGHTSERMTQTYVRKAKPRSPIKHKPK